MNRYNIHGLKGLEQVTRCKTNLESRIEELQLYAKNINKYCSKYKKILRTQTKK